MGPPARSFTTFAYGHSRVVTLNALEAAISGKRAAPETIRAGEKGKQFVNYTVSKEIYDTAWDHNIVLEATSNAGYYILQQ